VASEVYKDQSGGAAGGQICKEWFEDYLLIFTV
jgi:hypothetical protein